MQKLDILECLKPRSTLALLLLCLGLAIIPRVQAIKLSQNQQFYLWADNRLQPYKIKAEDLVVVEEEDKDLNRFVYRIQIKPKKSMILVYKSAVGPENDPVVRQTDGVIFLNKDQGYDLNLVMSYEDKQNFANANQLLGLFNEGDNVPRSLEMPFHPFERWNPQLLADTLLSNRKVLDSLANERFANDEIEGYEGKIYGIGTENVILTDSELGYSYLKYTKSVALEKIEKSYKSIITPRRNATLQSFNRIKREFSPSPESLAEKLQPIVEKGLAQFNDDGISFVLKKILPGAVYPLFKTSGFAKFLLKLEKYDINMAVSAMFSNIEGFRPKNLSFRNDPSDLGIGAVLIDQIIEDYKDYARDEINRVRKDFIPEKKNEDIEDIQRTIIQTTADEINVTLEEYKCAYTADELLELIEDIVKSLDVVEFVIEQMIEKVRRSIESFVRVYIVHTINYTLLRKLFLNMDRVVYPITASEDYKFVYIKVTDEVNHYGKMMGFNTETSQVFNGPVLFEDRRRMMI